MSEIITVILHTLCGCRRLFESEFPPRDEWIVPLSGEISWLPADPTERPEFPVRRFVLQRYAEKVAHYIETAR